MEETEEEILWRLENYSIENLRGKTLRYQHKGLVGFIMDLNGMDMSVRTVKIENINRDEKCVKVYRERTGFYGWVPLKRLKLISMK